jgi:hypothetical protein
MQYLLTQQEYEALHREKRLRTDGQTAELQKLCTLAAQHIPIVVEWSSDKTPQPWGCILGPREQHPGYCDKCPAQKVCPHEGKEWSK